jgi:glyoxylase-like metal-dependent hydrolase (beta-lactamase superfamily II)
MAAEGEGGHAPDASLAENEQDRFELDPAAGPAAQAAEATSPEPTSHEPTSHKGLTYPFGRRVPEAGELIEVAPGIGWARLPVPGSLKHINVYALEDGAGVALVDTGLDIPPSRAAWEQLFAGPLAGRTVTRILCTHFHPDHIGLAGWLCERFGVRLWMTRGEWLFARMLTLDVRDTPPPEAAAYQRAAGWSEERMAAEAEKGWGRFAAVVSPVPISMVRLEESDRISIGDRIWRIVTGNGHSPEHACLVDELGGVMIAGDQVLPRITSNVSLSLSEPEGDPLGDWLASIDKLCELQRGLLVLPGHGEPFTGLHARLDALAAGHLGRLDALEQHLAEPKRAVDCFGILFGRAIDDSVYGLATGEAGAHLRRLEIEGRAVREVRDGVHWFSAVTQSAA